MSAELVALVPPGVVTVTLTTLADLAGEVAVQVVLEEQLTEVPALPPKETVLEPTTKPVPVMVTMSVPPLPPAFGLTPVTVGTAS